MESSCILCGGVSTLLYKSPGNGRRPDESFSLYSRVLTGSRIPHSIWASARTKRRSGGKKGEENVGIIPKKKLGQPGDQRSLLTVNRKNGDPMGQKDLGKDVMKWICQGMKFMALDISKAEMQGRLSEFRQRMGPGLTFVIEAQPYLNAVPMPPGLEAICLKTCTHYPTLFDHFQRELRDVLQDLQHQSLIVDWRETESWKLLKELANSARHRAIARKTPLSLHGVLGMDLDKVKAIQRRID